LRSSGPARGDDSLRYPKGNVVEPDAETKVTVALEMQANGGRGTVDGRVPARGLPCAVWDDTGGKIERVAPFVAGGRVWIIVEQE